MHAAVYASYLLLGALQVSSEFRRKRIVGAHSRLRDYVNGQVKRPTYCVDNQSEGLSSLFGGALAVEC